MRIETGLTDILESRIGSDLVSDGLLGVRWRGNKDDSKLSSLGD